MTESSKTKTAVKTPVKTQSAVVKCPECGHDCKGKFGLTMHLLRQHHIAPNGTPLPATAPKDAETAKKLSPPAATPKVIKKLKTPLAVPLEIASRPVEPTVVPVSAAEKTFPCPECGKEYRFPTALGLHRRKAHGIIGSSHSVVSTQKRKASQIQAAVTALSQPSTQRSVNNDEISNTTVTTKGKDIQVPGDPIAYAICLGAIKEQCRHFAEEHGIPTREFTRGLAELFLREARR
jgi:hypothetical protein